MAGVSLESRRQWSLLDFQGHLSLGNVGVDLNMKGGRQWLERECGTVVRPRDCSRY